MNKIKPFDMESTLLELKLRRGRLEYDEAIIRNALQSILDIGMNATASKLGISKSTLRMWRNPTKNKKHMKTQYQVHHEKRLNEKRLRYQTDYDKVLEANKRHNRKRYHSDPNFRLRALIRTRVWRVIKDQSGEKLLRLSEYLGCNIEEFRKYFESKFQPGMTWENYGLWHIDHVKACSNFDLTKEGDQRACFHYTNLQPLWEKDNLTKSNK